jgi:hypothetical protein
MFFTGPPDNLKAGSSVMKRKRDDGAVAQETICQIRGSYQTRSNYNTGGSPAANGMNPNRYTDREVVVKSRVFFGTLWESPT